MATALNRVEDVDNLFSQRDLNSVQLIWKRLGQHLKQTPSTLRDIENNYPQNDTECLKEMIKIWFKQPEADEDKIIYLFKICMLHR